MAFVWTENFDLAQYLSSQTDSTVSQEALMRCAVGRAYYAAFCHARNYARDRHGLAVRSNGDDHSLVRRHFYSRREKGVSLKLASLRDMRNACDYADEISDLPRMLAQALTEAQKVIAILK